MAYIDTQLSFSGRRILFCSAKTKTRSNILVILLFHFHLMIRSYFPVSSPQYFWSPNLQHQQNCIPLVHDTAWSVSPHIYRYLSRTLSLTSHIQLIPGETYDPFDNHTIKLLRG